MKRVVPSTPEYADHQCVVRALHVAFTAAVTDATSTVNSDVIPNSTKRLAHPSRLPAGSKPWTKK
jgi:hypothetical protein